MSVKVGLIILFYFSKEIIKLRSTYASFMNRCLYYIGYQNMIICLNISRKWT